MEKIAGEYLLIEFPPENVEHLLTLLEKRFVRDGKEEWEGSLVILRYEKATGHVTVMDMFCNYDDQVLPWERFKEFVRRGGKSA